MSTDVKSVSNRKQLPGNVVRLRVVRVNGVSVEIGAGKPGMRALLVLGLANGLSTPPPAKRWGGETPTYSGQPVYITGSACTGPVTAPVAGDTSRDGSVEATNSS